MKQNKKGTTLVEVTRQLRRANYLLECRLGLVERATPSPERIARRAILRTFGMQVGREIIATHTTSELPKVLAAFGEKVLP